MLGLIGKNVHWSKTIAAMHYDLCDFVVKNKDIVVFLKSETH